MKSVTIVAVLSMLVLMFTATECRLSHSKRLSFTNIPCVPDSRLRNCIKSYNDLAPGSILDTTGSKFCTDCKTKLEEYAESCLGESLAQEYRDRLRTACDSDCIPNAAQQQCINSYREIAQGISGADSSFCTDCKSELEDYASSCLGTTLTQQYRDTLQRVCEGDCFPSRELRQCVTSYSEIVEGVRGADNFFCTDCRSDLEDYSMTCTTTSVVEQYRDTLQKVCDGDCFPNSELRECIAKYGELAQGTGGSDNTFCTNCKSQLEDYAMTCTSTSVAQQYSDILQKACDSNCFPNSDLRKCITSYREIVEGISGANSSFCTDCKSELEEYAMTCTSTSVGQRYSDIAQKVCDGDCLPNSELRQCIRDYNALVPGTSAEDSFCTNCRSELEEYAPTCTDESVAQEYMDTLDTSCKDESDPDKRSSSAGLVGETTFFTVSTILLVLISTLN